MRVLQLEGNAEDWELSDWLCVFETSTTPALQVGLDASVGGWMLGRAVQVEQCWGRS